MVVPQKDKLENDQRNDPARPVIHAPHERLRVKTKGFLANIGMDHGYLNRKSKSKFLMVCFD